MKKITLLAILAISLSGFAQQKSTGNITLSTNTTANLTLNNTTSKATLTLTGPSDRWFALQFGSFAIGGGMASGQDFVYFNGTSLVDGNHVGRQFPNTDASQNWTVTSNTVASGIRTVIAERNLSTGDANDYTFNYANTSIDFAWAKNGSAGQSLNYHGGNRGYNIDVPLSATLGVDDFSLKASSIYPNPSNGNFTIETKTGLDQITVYSLIGTLIQTIEVKDKSNTVEVSLKNLQTGIYLVELKNENDKSWKKIIIE
ncbi:T9SS type A sorting domain-containing protein [Flavobacterium pectinovorum]|uniref:T9SS type A sorting domain-containing protein n=1 Tax=Flavobacterium pectinovorum TaxID=29533 RepID=UPI001FAC5C56|nr:T9SS type A sorting domain-containing protein [Flavobacterium pectinovorum]MCI9843955.1 T9SS type A sorting domain-containing protein [Flavobacterium pectinovorum]